MASPYYHPLAPVPQLSMSGLVLCRITSVNGTQPGFTPYTVTVGIDYRGICSIEFDSNDGNDITEKRSFELPGSRKVWVYEWTLRHRHYMMKSL